ncbi:MAG: type II toxin-antitoxin system RelE/ParE family toxin [Nitrospirota bacterium]
MYKAVFYKQAARYYEKLDAKLQKRINRAMQEIIHNPVEGTHIKKLKGRLEGRYRYHIGDLRIIYYVSVDEKIVYVEAIGPRGDIYK